MRHKFDINLKKSFQTLSSYEMNKSFMKKKYKNPLLLYLMELNKFSFS
jgi:hypothetical protein